MSNKPKEVIPMGQSFELNLDYGDVLKVVVNGESVTEIPMPQDSKLTCYLNKRKTAWTG